MPNSILLPPPKTLLKAARRLNPAIDLDVDLVAIKRAAGASTREEWIAGTLTNVTADDKGQVRLNESGTLEIFKTGNSIAGATSKKNLVTTLTDIPQGPGSPRELLWLDFWPDPAVLGADGFVLHSVEFLLGRNGSGNPDDPYDNSLQLPIFEIKVAAFDNNWNREELTESVYLKGTDVTLTGGAVTINFRSLGRLIRIRTGRGRTRTGSGRTSAGAEQLLDVTIEGDKKVSHIETSYGFSIGIRVATWPNYPFIGCFPTATLTAFDQNNFWRALTIGAVSRAHGPYSPDADGPSALDTTKNAGYGYAETGAVPGFGAIDSITGKGKWGISREVNGQHRQHCTADGIDLGWEQPYHLVKAVTFAASGTAKKILDLGATPTGEVHFRADTVTPKGTSITFSIRGSNTNNGVDWSGAWSASDGDIFTAAQAYRYYEVTVTLSGSSDTLSSPQLNAIFITERTRYGTWKYARDFDSTVAIDPVTGQSSIGELKIPLLRLGRGDARDIATKIATDHPMSLVEAWVYIRETISGRRHFVNLYRLEDREPELGEEALTFVSGMDRLKVHVPPKMDTDQYPTDGTDGVITAVVYNSSVDAQTGTTSKRVRIEVAGTPFATKNIAGWQFDGLTGPLQGLSFLILASPAHTSNQFYITLEQDGQKPVAGDKFHLYSGKTERLEVNYSGQDFAAVYKDVLEVQAEVPSRYRGALPATTGRTTIGRLTVDGRPAIEPLQELALHCGGAPAWVKGRIAYIDLYGPKTSLETWNENDYSSLRPTVGANRRMPSVVVKYGYDFVKKSFQYEVTSNDGNALLGLGRANLFDVASLPDELCKWNDSAEAEHMAKKMLKAWSTGVRIWKVSLASPRPWREVGDCVTISTDQYTDRRLSFSADGLTDVGSPVRGRVSAVGVIIGKNLWGTEFEVAIFGLDNIQVTTTDGNRDPQPGPEVQSLNNFRFIDSADGTERTYHAIAGTDVYRVYIFDNQNIAPPTVDPWPAAGMTPTTILTPASGTRAISYTSKKPPRGFQRFIQFEPRMEDFSTGVVRRAVNDPANSAMAPKINATLLLFLWADLTVEVAAGPGDWPVTVDVFENTPSGTPIYSATKSANEIITKASSGAAALGGRSLPLRELRHWWVRLTNVAGETAWATSAIDRDPIPEGDVTPNDYRANPSFVCYYDDDTDEIKITLSNGATKSFTSGGGGLSTGGGIVTFAVGDVVTTGSPESAFAVDERRDGYKIEYRGGTTWRTIWQGSLHGQASNPPTAEPRVVLNTNGDLADAFVKVASPVGEQVRLFVKDAEDASAPVFGLVVGAADSTPRYVNSDTELGPSDYFFSTGSPVQKLNDIVLVRDQVKRIYVQVQGKDSLVKSSWIPVVLNLKNQPWLESFALTWDEATGLLRARARGGANCASVLVEVSASSIFSAPSTSAVSLADGAETTATFPLSGTQRGKTWYGRCTPFNAVSQGGLAGAAQIDEVAVPVAYSFTSEVTEDPAAGTGTLKISLTDSGLVVHQTDKVKFYRTVNGTRTLVAPTSSPPGTTGDFVLTSALEPLHNIKVEPIVYMADGSTRILGAWTFDRDRQANVVTASYGRSGSNAVVHATFDTDTATGATKARYRADGGIWNDLTVSVNRDVTFNVALSTSATQVVEIQGRDSDNNYGPSAYLTLEKDQSNGPSLTVTPTPGASSYSIAWSGTGVITVSIDGGAYSTPAASPISVTRHATVDIVYAFRSVLAGQTIENAITVPSVEKDTITPDLDVIQGTSTATTVPFTVNATNPSGGAAPTITARVYKTTMVINSVTYSETDGAVTISSGTVVTVNRPTAADTVQASVVFRASITSAGAETIMRTIAKQLHQGPSLTVTTTPGETSYSIAWSGDGTITVSIDGGAYSTPAASPISVTRGTVDKTYIFKAVKDNQEITNTVVIPRTYAGISVTLNNSVFDAVADTLAVTWSVTGAPSGVTYNLSLTQNGSDGVSANADNATSTYTFTGVTGATGAGTVRVDVLKDGVVIATKSRGGVWLT